MFSIQKLVKRVKQQIKTPTKKYASGYIYSSIIIPREVVELRTSTSQTQVLVTVQELLPEFKDRIRDYNVRLALNGGLEFTELEWKDFIKNLSEEVERAFILLREEK